MTGVASADIDAIAKALRRTGQDSEATTMSVLIESANYLLTEMRARVPVDSGALRRSLAIRVSGTTVQVGSDLDYAIYVELGTKPHKIQAKPGKTLAFMVGNQQVFARVVNHPGTKPQPFIQPALEAWMERIGYEVAAANVEVFVKEARKGA